MNLSVGEGASLAVLSSSLPIPSFASKGALSDVEGGAAEDINEFG